MRGAAAVFLLLASAGGSEAWASPNKAVLLSSAPLAAGPGLAAFNEAADLELARAKKGLSLPGYPKSYYIWLGAWDERQWERVCYLGPPYFSMSYRQRILTPQVRVGSYDFDNQPLSPPQAYMGAALDFGTDVAALRHGLWLILDASYKKAAADFLKKEGSRVLRGKAEYDTDDFTREPVAATGARGRPAGLWDERVLAALCEKGARIFEEVPWVLSGVASIDLSRRRLAVKDTEGRSLSLSRDVAKIELSAETLAKDGMRVSASRKFAAVIPEGLPAPEAVESSARGVLEDLGHLIVAATTSPFSAPALLDPGAAGVFIAAVASRMTGEEARDPEGAQIFMGKLGQRVLPADFSLDDDPARESFKGRPLAGSYHIDEQGIPAQRVSLIDRGMLRALLLSRYPVLGFNHSNGHGRAAPGFWPVGSPGVLRFSTARPRGRKWLLDRLTAECRGRGKPFGIFVSQANGFREEKRVEEHGSLRIMPGLLYLVDARSGEKTLVRGLDAVGTPWEFLSNILAAGGDPKASDIAGRVPVSVIAPSLLLGDLELQRSEETPQRPPILPPPSGGKS